MNIKLFIYILFAALMLSCGKKEETEVKHDGVNNTNQKETTNAKITFVELGSVNCIPCRQMQPVMKSIEEKFGGQVKVVFHDVWKDKAPAQKYGIQLIPTQVFLDENGKEFFRHEGFYAEEEIIKLFGTKNVKPLSN
ncbi:MAG: thioredoxin family protein [Ignavibacteria bacterium]|nr:thioredoxin family protein [Ignavibacteria bacterium]